MGISIDQVRIIINAIAAVIEEQKQYLTDLDAAIGDGDHGHNMARGFEAITNKLQESPGADIGEVFKNIAMMLISNVGGASGPLYGTLFLKASNAAQGMTEMDLAGFVPVFKEGVLGVQARGKAVIGEKTMLDVLIPVLQSLEKDSLAGVSCKQAFEKAAKLASACAEQTKNIQATKGRASYLGERSIGHIDPGAMSSCFIIQTISSALG